MTKEATCDGERKTLFTDAFCFLSSKYVREYSIHVSGVGWPLNNEKIYFNYFVLFLFLFIFLQIYGTTDVSRDSLNGKALN